MGLSVHVRVHAPASLDEPAVRAIVARWHGVAEGLAAEGRIDRVFELSNETADLDQFATAWISVPVAGDPDACAGVAVAPIEGWIFLVQLGKDSEPLVLGLCRYPATAKAPGGEGWISSGKNEGWHFLASCKTQYASLHGWELFRRCHVAAVDLALAGQTLGLEVRIEDEGGYWPGRNEVALRTAVERMNRLVAGLAGALKDAEDDSGKGLSVDSPILEHPAFERLEAEAQNSADASKLGDALRTVKNEVRFKASD
jgi:muconolactone delta-isomerase